MSAPPRVPRPRRPIGWFLVELAASVLTLFALWLGSSTAAGSFVYLTAQPFWFAIVIGRGLWGLAPLTVATTAVLLLNFWTVR